MRTRYWDAYVTARMTTTIGTVVKVIAIIVTAVIVLAGGLYGDQNNQVVQGLLGGLIMAIVFGTPLYVLGILVAALGQILKAALDSAVNSSPFLDNEDRATIMSL